MDMKLLKNLIEKLHMIPDHDDEGESMDDAIEPPANHLGDEHEDPKGISIVEIKATGKDKHKPGLELADDTQDADDDEDYKNSEIFKRLSKKA